MQVCKKCVLPDTYPGITFDAEGVCNYCNEYVTREKEDASLHFSSEEELMKALQNRKNPDGGYDCLLSASGGVDSSYTIIQIVEHFKLKPLVWHNDHGYEHETATNNVRKLCEALNIDLIIWQHDYTYMKKLWKFVIESDIPGANTCFMCANILYWNAVELADKFNINTIINGYSKGQVAFNKESGRNVIKEMINAMLASGDMDLFDWFLKKYEIMKKHKVYQRREDLVGNTEKRKILVVPFFIFDFYKTDKEKLKKICRERFDWQQMEEGYPARTTNCVMNWLTTYADLQKVNYSIYTDEYASLIRAGEFTRQQVLEDLEFNPPPGLLQRLAKEVGVQLDKRGK